MPNKDEFIERFETFLNTGKGDRVQLAKDIMRMLKLSKDFKDLKNELCIRCGRYKFKHEGFCNGCRWNEYDC